MTTRTRSAAVAPCLARGSARALAEGRDNPSNRLSKKCDLAHPGADAISPFTARRASEEVIVDDFHRYPVFQGSRRASPCRERRGMTKLSTSSESASSVVRQPQSALAGCARRPTWSSRAGLRGGASRRRRDAPRLRSRSFASRRGKPTHDSTSWPPPLKR